MPIRALDGADKITKLLDDYGLVQAKSDRDASIDGNLGAKGPRFGMSVLASHATCSRAS